MDITASGLPLRSFDRTRSNYDGLYDHRNELYIHTKMNTERYKKVEKIFQFKLPREYWRLRESMGELVRAGDGHSSMSLVSGPPGCGKTHFLELCEQSFRDEFNHPAATIGKLYCPAMTQMHENLMMSFANRMYSLLHQ